MAIETSKTFKRELTPREEWIEDLLAMGHYDHFILKKERCKELADLLKQNITPEKIIAYLMRVRLQRYSGFKCMTGNNEDLWVFKKKDILKIGENL